MKLNINFMIKDGKRIISRDTKGYKVLFNRITKEFAKINHLPAKEIDVTVIIQISEQSAYNNSGKYWAKCGQFDWSKMEIKMYKNNCSDKQMLLAFLAHEFGHLHHYKNDYMDWCIKGVLDKERYADKFAKRLTGVNPNSITGKVRSIAAMNRSK